MKAGSTELHANRLIAKWFKGEDLPMPVSGGDTANPSAAAALPGYVWTQGTLLNQILPLLKVQLLIKMMLTKYQRSIKVQE